MTTLDTTAAGKTAAHPGRRHYLIDARFQLKYTLLVVAFGGILMGAFGLAIWHEIHANSELAVGQQITAALGTPVPGAADFRSTLESADQRVFWTLVAACLAVMAGLGLAGILLSHRVAGPMLLLDRYTRALGEGAFPTIRPLRRGDEFQDYFAALQETVDRLRQREKQEIDVLEAAAAALRGSGPEVERAREALAALLRRKRESLEGGPGKS